MTTVSAQQTADPHCILNTISPTSSNTVMPSNEFDDVLTNQPVVIDNVSLFLFCARSLPPAH